MATKFSDYLYDLGFKGQGQIYLKSVLLLVTRSSFNFLIGVFIFIPKLAQNANSSFMF